MDESPEQLFLDVSIISIQNGTSGTKTVEPWASLYCSALLEQRYGDAIHARYSLDGNSPEGINQDTKRTVLEEIVSDARSYFAGYPEIYTEALVFYEGNSCEDTRPEIIEAIRRVPREYSPSAL